MREELHKGSAWPDCCNGTFTVMCDSCSLAIVTQCVVLSYHQEMRPLRAAQLTSL